MADSKTSPTSIKFQLLGVAELLETQEMQVPIFQRSYCWKDDAEVLEYWEDLHRSFPGDDEYFLGTVVLTTEGNGGRKTIIDGQQRLVTTSLLISAIRDELKNRGSEKYRIIERDYLAKETLKSEGKDPRLVLNSEDDSLFHAVASATLGSVPPSAEKMAPAIKKAYEFLGARMNEVANAVGDEAVERLLEWADFLSSRVRVGVIEVPTEAEAYIIFETLNNRGADLTTADLLKNYVYGRAGTSLEKVRDHWMRALGALELKAADSKFTAFLRHYWSSKHGLTRERDLYAAIKKKVNAKSSAVEFAESLSAAATQYAAIGNPIHEHWSGIGFAGRADLEVLAQFNLAPNRPLLLAAMGSFPGGELRKLLRALVSWSVRGMITGTINSGTIEERYCEAAVAIRRGEIKTAEEVRAKLGSAIPGDVQFQEAFAIAEVPRNGTARYYLLALERLLSKTAEPELVPNADGDQVNLEHVLPQKPTEADWPEFKTPEDRNSWAYRLGNMALLQKGPNGKIGNKAFSHKSPVLTLSSYQLTKEIGACANWTSIEIAARQKKLAEMAVKAWPR